MNQTSAETQAWHDECVARFATPDGTIEIHNGRDWARMRPMICPVCRNTFYGWTPLENPLPARVVDPGKPGTRQTCGHPFCYKAENEYGLFPHVVRGADVGLDL